MAEAYESILVHRLFDLHVLGADVREGCSEIALEHTVEQIDRELGIVPPASYLHFLRHSNGLIWEDLVFCHVRDEEAKSTFLRQPQPDFELPAVNHHYRQACLPEHFIVLGFSEEGIAICDFRREDFYAILDPNTQQERLVFDSFTDLFHYQVEGWEE